MNDDRPGVGGRNADLEEAPGVIRADQHDESFVELLRPNRIIERMEDWVVADTVAPGAGRDDWLIHLHKLPCDGLVSKITCGGAATGRADTAAAEEHGDRTARGCD